MTSFAHGGDTYGLGNVLDFSASLNPLGIPEVALISLRMTPDAFEAYPDPLCRDLTAALAQRWGVAPERLLMTSGAGDAFTRVALAVKPQTVVVCDPCYSGYEQALASAQIEQVRVRHVALKPENNFDVDVQAFSAALDGADLAFLCTPNNPTGRAVALDDIRAVLDAAPADGTVLVLDECFAQLAGLESAFPLVDEYPNLVLVRAFTKTYAMAGLRLGYCATSDDALMERLRAAGVPWAVSGPAQVAGVAALADVDYLARTREVVDAQRERMERALADVGARVIPSVANYIMFRCDTPLYQPLLERGICIRRCETFEGLDGSWYRVAVRAPEENTQFIEAIREVLA